MATENVGVVHTDKFTQSVPLNRIGKSLGKNVSSLVVGSDVADVHALRSNNFGEPLQVDSVRAG